MRGVVRTVCRTVATLLNLDATLRVSSSKSILQEGKERRGREEGKAWRGKRGGRDGMEAGQTGMAEDSEGAGEGKIR